MKKILIAIDEDFVRRVYSSLFQEEGFQVIEAKGGKEALDLARKETPDIILADISLSEMNGLELLKSLKKEELTKKIPVVICARFENEEIRKKAIELEAKDFIERSRTTPPEVVLKIKIHLGEQRTYQLIIGQDLYPNQKLSKLSEDLGYEGSLKCHRCRNPLSLFLIRDFSKGKNYFKVSFKCPKCS